MANAYCDHLGIAVPRQIQLAALRGTNYLDILIVALLERGGPMTMDEIMAAVEPCWANSPERMRVSLTKAWGGRAPVVKDPEGRFALDLDSRRMNAVLVRLGFRAGLQPWAARPPLASWRGRT